MPTRPSTRRRSSESRSRLPRSACANPDAASGARAAFNLQLDHLLAEPLSKSLHKSKDDFRIRPVRRRVRAAAVVLFLMAGAACDALEFEVGQFAVHVLFALLLKQGARF